MSATSTLSSPSILLTESQRQHYWDEGFVVVPNILSEEEMERYRVRARQIALGDYPPEAARKIVKDVRVAKGVYTPDDPEKGIWKFLNPDRFDPVFQDYPAHPNLLNVVEQLIGPDLKAFLLMFIYKPPGLNAVHPYHQDSYYFSFAPHDGIVGTWVALDRASADNGTLSVIRKSHKLDVLRHALPKEDMVNFGTFGVEGYDGHPDEVVLEVQPGDGVFFHSRLLHRTGPSTSDRHRRVLTVHFASAQCKFTAKPLSEYGFRLVRGRNYEGCI